MDVDRRLERRRHDLDGLAVGARRRPGRAGRRGRPSSRAGRASGGGRRRRRASGPAGTPPGTSSPSTATRQCRARAPSMTSTPRSSAVARLPAVSAVASDLQVDASCLDRPSGVGRGPAGRPGCWTQASAADPRGAGLAELAVGRDVGEPAEVGRRRATPSRSTEPIGRRSTAPSRRSRGSRSGPAASGPSQSGGSPSGRSVRSATTCGTRLADGRARWRWPRPRRSSPTARVSAIADHDPVDEPAAAERRPRRAGGGRCRDR